MANANKGGRPRRYKETGRLSISVEAALLDASRLAARAEHDSLSALIQKALREYIERNHPAALQPGARITATITADHAG